MVVPVKEMVRTMRPADLDVEVREGRVLLKMHGAQGVVSVAQVSAADWENMLRGWAGNAGMILLPRIDAANFVAALAKACPEDES